MLSFMLMESVCMSEAGGVGMADVVLYVDEESSDCDLF